MSRKQIRRKLIGAFVVLGIALIILGIVGFMHPVEELSWGFWVPLAVVVVGLFVSLVLALFHDWIFADTKR